MRHFYLPHLHNILICELAALKKWNLIRFLLLCIIFIIICTGIEAYRERVSATQWWFCICHFSISGKFLTPLSFVILRIYNVEQ